MKELIRNTVNLFSKGFYFFGTLASIVGVLLLIFFRDNNETTLLIALVYFCLMLLIFTAYLIYALNKILSVRNVDVYVNKSTTVLYEAVDINTINYEVHKLIQSKRPILTEINYEFGWTGSKFPTIESEIQDVKNVIDNKDPNKADVAILGFRKPLYYNENQVVHFRAKMKDADQKSSTYVATKVEKSVDLIHYRVVLRYKLDTFQGVAKVTRLKIGSMREKYEEIEQIPFDNQTKSFEYRLLNPDVGFKYKISWER